MDCMRLAQRRKAFRLVTQNVILVNLKGAYMMKNGRKVCLSAMALFAFALAPVVRAQTAAANEPAGTVVLKEGSDVKLKFAQELSSKTASEGDTVNFVLAEDLTVGTVVVAKAGDKAVGTVSNAKKAGMMGKGGELSVRLEHLKAGDTKVRLRGSKGKAGDDKTGQAVALTVLFGPIGLIKHGKDIVVKEGTPLNAYVDEDTTFPVLKAETGLSPALR